MAGYKETDAPTKLINRLKEATKDYSLESVKAALAQSTLNKKQIESILAQKGMQGELLKTTADEIANAASTKAVSENNRKSPDKMQRHKDHLMKIQELPMKKIDRLMRVPGNFKK